MKGLREQLKINTPQKALLLIEKGLKGGWSRTI